MPIRQPETKVKRDASGYWTARHKGRTGQGWSEAEAMKNLMQALRDNPVRPRPKGDNK
jgi:hypothetical protein|tara:strand:+ start:407 stop:580 length:174 start_codon:yes stop_codon:yes gene_type:complete